MSKFFRDKYHGPSIRVHTKNGSNVMSNTAILRQLRKHEKEIEELTDFARQQCERSNLGSFDELFAEYKATAAGKDHVR